MSVGGGKQMCGVNALSVATSGHSDGTVFFGFAIASLLGGRQIHFYVSGW